MREGVSSFLSPPLEVLTTEDEQFRLFRRGERAFPVDLAGEAAPLRGALARELLKLVKSDSLRKEKLLRIVPNKALKTSLRRTRRGRSIQVSEAIFRSKRRPASASVLGAKSVESWSSNRLSNVRPGARRYKLKHFPHRISALEPRPSVT